MADGHQRMAWTHTATLAVWFHSTITGESIDPQYVMPLRYRDLSEPAEKSEAAKKRETDVALFALEQFFTQGK